MTSLCLDYRWHKALSSDYKITICIPYLGFDFRLQILFLKIQILFTYKQKNTLILTTSHLFSYLIGRQLSSKHSLELSSLLSICHSYLGFYYLTIVSFYQHKNPLYIQQKDYFGINYKSCLSHSFLLTEQLMGGNVNDRHLR